MFKQIIIGALMPKPKNHGKAREALGISRDGVQITNDTKIVPPPNMSRPEIEQIMQDAVAAGIATGENEIMSLNNATKKIAAMGMNPEDFILNDGSPLVTPREAGAMITPTELSPEYHAGLASRMVERLDADAARLADALEAEQKQHDTLMAALRAELAGVRKVREAYGHVSVILTPVEPAPADADTPEPVVPLKRGYGYPEEFISVGARFIMSQGQDETDQKVEVVDPNDKNAEWRVAINGHNRFVKSVNFKGPALVIYPAKITKIFGRKRTPRPGHRETFEIPPGHEAVLDAEDRATGETRPIIKPE